MKKIVLALFGLGVLGGGSYTGLAWHAGNKAEADLTKLKQDISENVLKQYVGDTLKITNIKTTKHFMGATTEFDVVLDPKGFRALVKKIAECDPIDSPNAEAEKPKSITIIQHVKVGPMLNTSKGREFGWYNVEYEIKSDQAIFKDLPPKGKDALKSFNENIKIGYFVDFNEKRHAYLHHKAYSFTERHAKFEIPSATYELNFDKQWTTFDYGVAYPTITIRDERAERSESFKIEGLNLKGDKLNFDFNIAKISFDDNRNAFELNKFSVNAKQNSKAMFDGHANFKIQDIAVNKKTDGKPEPLFKLANLDYLFTAKTTGDFADINYKINADCTDCKDFKINEQAIKHINLDYGFYHLHTPSITPLMNTYVDVLKKGFSVAMKAGMQEMCKTPAGDEQATQAQFNELFKEFMTNYTNVLVNILKNSPQIKLNQFVLKTDDATQMRFQFALGYKPLDEQETEALKATLINIYANDPRLGALLGLEPVPEPPIDPMAMAKKVIFSADVKISEKYLSADISKNVEKFINGGWLKKDKGDLVTNIKLEDGKTQILDKKYESFDELQAAGKALAAGK